MKTRPAFTMRFFVEPISGKSPVQKWLNNLSKEERKIIGHDILVVQWSWPLAGPLARYLGNGIWEIRSTLENRIARIIFIIRGRNIILLNGFIKKTQKTPSHEILVALRRKKEFDYYEEIADEN
jgi:phage-related protein